MNPLHRILVFTWSKARKRNFVKRAFYCLAFFCVAEYFLNVLGLFLYMRSSNFNSWTYPAEGDIIGPMKSVLRGETPEIPPLNNFNNYSFVRDPGKKKCSPAPRVLFVVKSAVQNFERRATIRKSWGFESRFSDVTLRTVFTVGNPADLSLLPALEKESVANADIIHADFSDTYFNNTLKTLLGMKWAVQNCFNADYYLFVDDDYYVSAKNLLRFLRYPGDYPHKVLYEEKEVVRAREAMREAVNKKNSRSLTSFEAEKLPLGVAKDFSNSSGFYVGFLFSGSAPKRWAWSKWYVSLDEYPFGRFPPYITAGAILLDRDTLLRLYLGALFTRLLRFDDPYLGIVAQKANVLPMHSRYFVFDPHSWYEMLFGPGFDYVIASHGYSDPKTLSETWHRAKEAGHA